MGVCQQVGAGRTLCGVESFVAIVISLFSVVLTGVMTTRARKLEHQLAADRHRESKAEQIEELISRYREPLLLAAHSLQSRLHNAVGGDYFPRWLHCGDPEEERYARDFTVYVLAEYLCWVEIIRREMQFLDLGDEARNRDLHRHMQAVSRAFGTSKLERQHFRLFRGQQRAIGELMMVTNGSGRSDCMTYPDFCSRLDNSPEFARWFIRLRSDVDATLTNDWVGNERLVTAQWALIDLIDFLDPNRTRIPEDRNKLVETAAANVTVPVA